MRFFIILTDYIRVIHTFVRDICMKDVGFDRSSEFIQYFSEKYYRRGFKDVGTFSTELISFI